MQAETACTTWTFSAQNRGPILQRHRLFDGFHADDLLIEEWAYNKHIDMLIRDWRVGLRLENRKYSIHPVSQNEISKIATEITHLSTVSISLTAYPHLVVSSISYVKSTAIS